MGVLSSLLCKSLAILVNFSYLVIAVNIIFVNPKKYYKNSGH